MSKIIRLDPRRKIAADPVDGMEPETEIFSFDSKKLIFDLVSIPPADRHRNCGFCQDRASRWYRVSQCNLKLFFDENILFCLNPDCARQARKEIRRIAPHPYVPAAMQKIKNFPVVMKNLLFPPKPDQDDPT